MPLSQNPIVEWPPELQQLLQGLQITTGADGKRSGRIDLDVDPKTLFLLNEFEARVRHRQVRLRRADSAECLVGEMNVLVGLGAAADPTRHIGKVRISFYDIQDDSCVDPAPQR
ncbi:hypothetical protein DC522_28260 [Microvirga sp. KLBC 81]|uniref:hypothetical protein n=1 Tax=Microvirga sp. KLBC 81 TaxID=1862707 RepID=UPI000D525679|nr:hypothetical protein [Microvirga sp. KLBC 81]PVE21121.1 hypothetical protein DC522_28260 [Microvirga sp. KLBC 81]